MEVPAGEEVDVSEATPGDEDNDLRIDSKNKNLSKLSDDDAKKEKRFFSSKVMETYSIEVNE